MLPSEYVFFLLDCCNVCTLKDASVQHFSFQDKGTSNEHLILKLLEGLQSSAIVLINLINQMNQCLIITVIGVLSASSAIYFSLSKCNIQVYCHRQAPLICFSTRVSSLMRMLTNCLSTVEATICTSHRSEFPRKLLSISHSKQSSRRR